KNSVGQYQVHVHYIDQENKRRYVTETVVEVQKSTPTATITIQNNNKDNGTFDVIISNVYSPKGVRTVQVPTWSEVNGQDDLTWYEATRQSDGTYKVSVKASDHKFSTGTYHVHLYYIQGDGSQVGVGGTTVQVENRNFVTRNQLYLKHISAKDADGQLGRVLKAASSLIGVETGSPEHLKLVRDYNSVHPLPVGYPVKNTDDWCDVFVTTVFQREGLSHLIGRECGVERHIQIFKHLGIWNENGTSTPKSGDIITFNWDQDSQPNNGFADHIGIVEYVENGLIHTIEGNSGYVGTVKRNVYRIGHGNIRGFATPRYR
ncbi:GBS Bsp-like repeat-containing protein, partial [Streptococcus sp. DFI.7.26]